MLVHACVFLEIAVVIVLAIQLSFFPDNKPTKVWRNIFTKLRSFRLKIKKKLQGGCRCSSKEICLRDRALNTLLDRMR